MYCFMNRGGLKQDERVSTAPNLGLKFYPLVTLKPKSKLLSILSSVERLREF